MKIRNPRYNVHGTIDCELEHPDFGWLPFTADPEDTEEQGRTIFERILTSGIEISPAPSIPLDQLTARKRTEIDQARDQAFAAGLEYEIAGEPDVIQTRPQDQINLLGLSAKAQRLIATGHPDAVFTFRGLSNINHELTAVEMDELALAALAHIESIYQRSWDRKDAIDAILADDGLEEGTKRSSIEAMGW
ncbi:DUF4376 domain-containing protein [Billgrantia desiderata]|uniref:DUF4376 domain-containing protein n=1 Tax=Billgrantia desiderata TaxID=52021 RepID=UPI00089E85B2|nr:DUF4376 domain-containing protein [Halomonas desiderata]SEG44124.1 protein of unknown function [Halomonas desiderata]